MIAANVHAIEEARKVQAEIAAARECPKSLVGWQRDRHGLWLEKVAGTAKAQYKLVFDCQPNLEFWIAVKYSFDSGNYVSGRAAGPLEISYGHFTEPSSIGIASTDDAWVVAAKVVGEQSSTQQALPADARKPSRG